MVPGGSRNSPSWKGWLTFLMPSVEGGLEPGMSLNIEVGYYLQGVYGFLCEDTMVVTENGLERFTHNSKALVYDDFMAGVTV